METDRCHRFIDLIGIARTVSVLQLVCWLVDWLGISQLCATAKFCRVDTVYIMVLHRNGEIISI